MAENGNDSEFVGRASQIWTMLDDMAEHNPDAYRKFIDKQLKEGKEVMAPPKPDMCVQTCIKSTRMPVFVNICSWQRVPKPKSGSDPIPIHGTPFKEHKCEAEEDYLSACVAANPEVIAEFGSTCKGPELDLLINLVFDLLDDQNKTTLSRNYTTLKNVKYKGDLKTIPKLFNIKDPLGDEMEKLSSMFAPLVDITTKDPSLMDKLREGGDPRLNAANDVEVEQAEQHIRIPGLSDKKNPSKLIQEVKLRPEYTICPETRDMMRQLLVNIKLTEVTSVKQCTLDVTEVGLTLHALQYELDLSLPETVQPDSVKAKFYKNTQTLTVTLPCKNLS